MQKLDLASFCPGPGPDFAIVCKAQNMTTPRRVLPYGCARFVSSIGRGRIACGEGELLHSGITPFVEREPVEVAHQIKNANRIEQSRRPSSGLVSKRIVKDHYALQILGPHSRLPATCRGIYIPTLHIGDYTYISRRQIHSLWKGRMMYHGRSPKAS